jgi:cell division protein YceG involved in septum cleavage
MLKLKTIKEKIYLLFLLVLQIGYYNTPCFANNTPPIQNVQDLFKNHDIDKIESELKNASSKKRQKILEIIKIYVLLHRFRTVTQSVESQ